MSVMLQANGVSYSWNDSSSLGLTDISVEFCSDESNFIVGPSGSGKTTLALILAGLVNPSIGNVTVSTNESVLNHLDVAYVFQFPESLFFCDSVKEEFIEQGGEEAWQSGRMVLEQLGADASAIEQVHPLHLSLGFGRIVAIALQVSRDPRVLIADEPTISLDWKYRHRVIEFLKNWHNEDRLLITITHDLDLMKQLGGQTTILQNGRVEWCGRTTELLDDESLLRSYSLT